MDGDPKNGTENKDEGGVNKTDPIPAQGGKTQTDIKIQQGQVSLDTMDADLTAAVQAGDEQHVRARLGGDRKLSEAEALILVKTREEEERIAYQQAHAQELQTADVHRKEEGESMFGWLHANNNWESEARSPSASRTAAEGVQKDGFIYDRDGGRTDANWGFHQSRDGTITTQNGEVFNVKTNTSTLANGEKVETLSTGLKAAAAAAGESLEDTAAQKVRLAQAIQNAGHAAAAAAPNNAIASGATTSKGDRSEELQRTNKPISRDAWDKADHVMQVEHKCGTEGQTLARYAEGKPPAPQIQAILRETGAPAGRVSNTRAEDIQYEVVNNSDGAPTVNIVESHFVAPAEKSSKFGSIAAAQAMADEPPKDAPPQGAPQAPRPGPKPA